MATPGTIRTTLKEFLDASELELPSHAEWLVDTLRKVRKESTQKARSSEGRKLQSAIFPPGYAFFLQEVTSNHRPQRRTHRTISVLLNTV
eukprot:3892918-Rhodomonas_salina.1